MRGFGLSAVNAALIRQPLPDDALNRLGRALGIGNVKRRALIVPEVEFAQIPLKVLLRDMMIRTHHATLERPPRTESRAPRIASYGFRRNR